MFPWLEVMRSPEESPVGDAEALQGESKEATSSAPEPGQETPETEARVPYPRFKEINDKYADALSELEVLKGKEPEKAPPSAVSKEEMKSMMSDALKDLGLGTFAAEAKQLRVEQKREQILSKLRTSPEFNEERDIPRILAKMKDAQANGENIGAVNAFKLINMDTPAKTPTAHDATGTTTGKDGQKGPVGNPNMSENQQRELGVQQSFKKMLGKDPAFRRALELDK